jgi:hypothetical protein
MQKELTREAKVKLAKEIQTVFKEPTLKNTEKLKMLERIVLRVSTEQKQEYKRLSKETKTPLAKIVRNSLNTIIKNKSIQKIRQITPQERKDNFVKFQKKLGLIE